MEKFILEAEDIHKSYYSHGEIKVLSGIDLKLLKGQSIVIMGASGEGKTTLLHILGALEQPSHGKVFIKDEYVNKKTAAKIRNSYISFIFQTYNLLEDLKVIDNILMPAKIARKNNEKMYAHGLKLLKEVNLENRKNYLTKLLSGGEKQRVAIARSFCNNPDIILADEPSGNLDHINSKNIHKLLISSVKKKNKSLIVATHDTELANLCDEKFLLKEGKLIRDS